MFMTTKTRSPVAEPEIPLYPQPAIVARSIERRFGAGETAVHALRGIDLELEAGNLTAVMGPSGSGKSTLMHVLAGLDSPDGGSVEIEGREITGMSDRELTALRRDRIGFVFQSFNLLPVLTAEENVVLPLQIAGRKPDRRWLAELIGRVGLDERREHRPAELSGGQQQRVAIARALVNKPAIVFADEPTGNLDSSSGADVLRLIREVTDELAQTTLMVTHDPRAAATADRVVFIADGRVAGDLDAPDEDRIAAAMQEVTR